MSKETYKSGIFTYHSDEQKQASSDVIEKNTANIEKPKNLIDFQNDPNSSFEDLIEIQNTKKEQTKAQQIKEQQTKEQQSTTTKSRL